MKRAEKGFSLLELVVVVAVMLIVTAISLPTVRRTVNSYRLDVTGHAVASMLQQVRSAAVKNDTPYYVQYDGVAGPGLAFAVPAARYIPLTYVPNTDPTVSVATNVGFMPVGGVPPNDAQLQAAMGLGAGVVPQIGGPIGFSARGLPCTLTGTAWRCTGPVAFEWFMQNNITQQWEAITVSPAGRIRSWRMTGAGVWQ